jgi:preprotein translocase subunit SecE
MVNVITFLKEVRQELLKVNWPNFDEFVGATLVVLIVIAFFAAFLGAVDYVLRLIMEYVYVL